MSKTDETFQEAILTLREWLGFLDRKERDLKEQIERARRKSLDSAPPSEAAAQDLSLGLGEEESVTQQEEGKPEVWL